MRTRTKTEAIKRIVTVRNRTSLQHALSVRGGERTMTKKEAKKVVAELMGWDKPRIVMVPSDVDHEDIESLEDTRYYYVTAVDPLSGARKVYDEDDGYFK